MSLSELYIDYSKISTDKKIENLGVFSKRSYKKNEIIEIAPLIEIDGSQTLPHPLQDYVFSSHIKQGNYVLVLGYGSMYNHSRNNNVDYYTCGDNYKRFVKYVANKDINSYEELFINYGEHHSVNLLIK